MFMWSKDRNISYFMPKMMLRNGIFNGMTGDNITIYPFAFEKTQDLYQTIEQVVQFIKAPVISQDLLE